MRPFLILLFSVFTWIQNMKLSTLLQHHKEFAAKPGTNTTYPIMATVTGQLPPAAASSKVLEGRAPKKALEMIGEIHHNSAILAWIEARITHINHTVTVKLPAKALLLTPLETDPSGEVEIFLGETLALRSHLRRLEVNLKALVTQTRPEPQFDRRRNPSDPLTEIVTATVNNYDGDEALTMYAWVAERLRIVNDAIQEKNWSVDVGAVPDWINSVFQRANYAKGEYTAKEVKGILAGT